MVSLFIELFFEYMKLLNELLIIFVGWTRTEYKDEKSGEVVGYYYWHVSASKIVFFYLPLLYNVLNKLL